MVGGVEGGGVVVQGVRQEGVCVAGRVVVPWMDW